MDARLAKLDWMSADTKVKARAKLAGIKTMIGYPARWRDYSGLKIEADDVVGNVVRARRFEYDRQLKKLGRPFDREEWALPVVASTGFAVHAARQIVFPAATLQPPFFDPNADDAVNYGAIGHSIGHELSHHFDDTGRKFDPQGNLIEWWTPADLERFEARTAELVKQFGEYEALPGLKVNGRLTLGENIADLAGLAVAYNAYKLSLQGREAPVIGGMTGDQRFFLGFAQSQRDKASEAFLRQLVATNPHSPSRFRVNTVRNFDPWYQAFGVRDGALYLAPEKRVRIW
jgi:putative endopeptidase